MTLNKKLLLKTLLILLISIFTLTAVFFTIVFTPFGKTKTFNPNEYKYDLQYCNELNEIPVFTQETAYTCNVASMAIVKNYFGFKTTEQEIRNELSILNRRTGMLPKDYLSYSKKIFEPLNYSVLLINPATQSGILNAISDSIEHNLPVVIMYSATDDWNKPHYNTHYSVIYGINMSNKTVKLSNPYGRLEVLSFQELYDGLDFASYEAMPFGFRVARKFGVIAKNNIFVFEPRL